MSQLRNIMFNHAGAAPFTPLPYCFFAPSPVMTDIIPSSSWTHIRFEFMLSSDCPNNTFIMGSRTSSSATDRLYLQNNNNYNRLANSLGNVSGIYTALADMYGYTEWHLDILNNRYEVINGGATVTTSTGGRSIPDGTWAISIGAITNSGAFPAARPRMYFYRMQITSNLDVLYEIKPVKDSNNVVCLYDYINEKFYYPIAGEPLYEDFVNA